MLQIQNFIFRDFHLDVFVNKNNNLLFFAKEVAEILGYKDTDQAIRRHVEEEDRMEFKDLQGLVEKDLPVPPNKIFINEKGFYSLIFGSRLPQAEVFRDWFFREVFPQVKKIGGYSRNNALWKLKNISEEEIRNMDHVHKKEFEEILKNLEDLLE